MCVDQRNEVKIKPRHLEILRPTEAYGSVQLYMCTQAGQVLCLNPRTFDCHVRARRAVIKSGFMRRVLLARNRQRKPRR